MSTPAAGDLQGGGQLVTRTPIVSATLVFEANARADPDASRLVTLTRGLTTLYKQSKARRGAVKLRSDLREEQRNWDSGTILDFGTQFCHLLALC